MNKRDRESLEACRLMDAITDNLKTAERCAVVIGMETPWHIIRAEAIDSWVADPTRRPRLLMVVSSKTTLGDVEWLLSR